MIDFFGRLITGIIGAIIMLIANQLYTYIKEKRSPYTGMWEDRIYDDNYNVIKRDVFFLKQNGDKITGFGKRIFPLSKNHQEFKVSGKLRGKDFAAIFWTTDKSFLTYGCWYLSQKSDNHFEGYYLKLDKTGAYKQIKADLERSDKSKSIFKK